MSKFVAHMRPKGGFRGSAITRLPPVRSGWNLNGRAAKWYRIVCKRSEVAIASESRDINWRFFVCARGVEITYCVAHVGLPLSSEWNFPRREIRQHRPRYRYSLTLRSSIRFFPLRSFPLGITTPKFDNFWIFSKNISGNCRILHCRVLSGGSIAL